MDRLGWLVGGFESFEGLRRVSMVLRYEKCDLLAFPSSGIACLMEALRQISLVVEDGAFVLANGAIVWTPE